jgi:NADH-quinone oxidoreductase subunit J
MQTLFYVSAVVAALAALLAVTRQHAVYALLSLIVSLLGLALAIFALGAPFAAALEVIIYAGAIMVLFVFVVMMLSLGRETMRQEREWQPWAGWVLPGVLGLILAGEWLYVCLQAPAAAGGPTEVGPAEVGASLFQVYLLGVELASALLLAGMVGAFHLARQDGAEGKEAPR